MKKTTGQPALVDPCAALFFLVTELINFGDGTYDREEQKLMCGLSQRQRAALFTLELGTRNNPDGISLSEVAQAMAIPVPSASQLIETLVKKGLSERTVNPNNHRTVQIKLSELGRRLTRQIALAISKKLGELQEGLSCQEVETFEKVILHCHARKGKILRKNQ